MATIFAFVAGLVFGIGLIVAGMTNPAKILGFLDFAGSWDPSLALVMAGAIAVGLVAFALARRRTMSALGLPIAVAGSADDRCAARRRQPSCSASAGDSPGSVRGPRSSRSARAT